MRMREAMTDRRLRVRVIAMSMAAASVVTLGGCSVLSPDNLPTSQAMDDGPIVKVDFGSVVNLPLQAPVLVSGMKVGAVQAIDVEKGSAVATLRVDEGVTVGKNATVELRQDTLLGDTYVSIQNPSDAWSQKLPDGGTIAKDRVKPPVQIEDLMKSLSNFLGGGSLPQLGNSFSQLNAQFPDDPKTVTRLTGVVDETVTSIAADTEHLNMLLAGLAKTTEELGKMSNRFGFVLSDAGYRQIQGITDPNLWITIVSDLEVSLRTVVPAAPLLAALTRAIETVIKPFLIPGWPDTSGPSTAERVLALFSDTVIPSLKSTPSVNIRSVQIENDMSDRQLAAGMVRVLRQLGVVH